MKKTILFLAIMAATSTAFAGGNNNQNGPRFGGGGDSTAVAGAAAGAVAGAAAGANASNRNTNRIGVGVSNKTVGINEQSQSLHNTNTGVNSQGQSLVNTNDLSNRNTNLQGQSLYNKNTAVGVGGNAKQGQLQGQGQEQGQSQSSKQANAQSMTYNEANGVHYSGGYEAKIRNTPDAVAPSIQPSAPCAIPLAGAGAGPGVSISLGTAYVEKGCVLRETVRIGLSGDAVSRNLANQVIQGKLLEYLEQEDELAKARMEEAEELESAKAVGGYESIWDNPYL